MAEYVVVMMVKGSTITNQQTLPWSAMAPGYRKSHLDGQIGDVQRNRWPVPSKSSTYGKSSVRWVNLHLNLTMLNVTRFTFHGDMHRWSIITANRNISKTKNQKHVIWLHGHGYLSSSANHQFTSWFTTGVSQFIRVLLNHP